MITPAHREERRKRQYGEWQEVNLGFGRRLKHAAQRCARFTLRTNVDH
jgi:hypothetical protein